MTVAKFPWYINTPTFVFDEEPVSLFSRPGFALEGFVVGSFFFAAEDEGEAVEDEDLFTPAVAGDEEGFNDDEEDDLIFASSASKAGARVLTTASKSDCFDRDWTAREMKI